MPSSSVFDITCYIARYPDLQAGTMNYGRGNFFGYASNYSDAVKDFTRIVNLNRAAVLAAPDVPYTPYLVTRDAALQFKTYGQLLENRMGGCDLPGTIYDTAFYAAAYLARYPDLREDPAIIANPYNHYLTIGQKQGRIPGYEILSETSPTGLTTPGTTVFVSNGQSPTDAITSVQSSTGVAPGDGTQVLNSSGAPIAPGTVPPTTPVSSFLTWLQNNEITAAGIALAGIFAIYELTKKKRP